MNTHVNLRNRNSALKGSWILLLALFLVLVAGCADDESENQGTLAIIGNYTDNWGSDHQITQTSWTAFAGASVIDISFYYNEAEFLVGQNDAVNSWNPSKYSRQDWTWFGGDLYYCSSAYDKDTLEEAYATSADPTDPTTSGCFGSPWTNLTP